MKFSATTVLAALAAVASAVPVCKPPVYTLPKIGEGAELTPPAASLVLKKIAIGHGIQNYTCAANTGDSVATGALAILHDVTSFYPGTERTGVPQNAWDGLPSNLLWNTPFPLNKLAGTEYGADPTTPFPVTGDLRLKGVPPAKFLGHHFFDSKGTPVFDLPAAGLKAVLKKTDTKTAPSGADKGIIGTGAVAWLQLDDNGTGQSVGVASVYRVITAGGAPQPCSAVGAGVQSVPYTTFYWFF
ncbi:hypothetical protein B0J18DRAFT_409402 [Chaetomium sp. MPI-SDFR-AT-0129]|nr:hypothetical protein B0J18DRAFT_409402 [Chaetomium sp. MPI-SDFR-AT-0129]